MAEAPLPIDIPNRATFKAAEVCELVKVQSYVLRSWENEFPELGVVKAAGGPRVYRRADVEQVVRIKHLLLVEGLTLAGARRRLEEAAASASGSVAAAGPSLAAVPRAAEAAAGPVAVRGSAAAPGHETETRNRLAEVKQGLRSILDLLSDEAAADAAEDEFTLEGQRAHVEAPARSVARPRTARPHGDRTAPRNRSGARKRLA